MVTKKKLKKAHYYKYIINKRNEQHKLNVIKSLNQLGVLWNPWKEAIKNKKGQFNLFEYI